MALTIADKPLSCHPPSSHDSILYAFLPTVVKSRLPVLNSVRRSLKMTTLRRISPPHHGLYSESSMDDPADQPTLFTNTSHELLTTGPLWQMTQRPRDASPDALSANTSLSSSLSSSPPPPPPPTSRSPVTTTTHLGPAPRRSFQESRTGVEWDSAVTALLLLSKACNRAQQPNAKAENTRALVIDANKWLLRSLPHHLSARELEELSQLLPASLVDRSGTLDRPDQGPSSSDPRSWLRRSIAFLILQTSLLVALVIPFLLGLANSCYRVERQSQLTERFLTGGIDMTNLVGERGLALKDAVLRLGQGRMANALVRSTVWTIDSVIGGVSDSAGEGVAIVGEAMLLRGGSPMR
jgi:hypothetical protein